MRYRSMRQEIMDRLMYELETIRQMGFTEYFLIVKDIIDYCRKRKIPCVGRGSAGDSLVSYVLGITQVDPIQYKLYFERFLNPERKELPDIDLDLCWKRRDCVIDYVYKKYGHDRTAMICTFNTFGMRSAIADVAKAYGLPEEEARSLTRNLPHWKMDNLEYALKTIPECRDIPLQGKVYRKIISAGEKISGFPRHISVHPGGVVIAPDHITNYTALQQSAKGIVTSQHDMYSIEKLGLVKIDLLGVRSLSIIADCKELLAKKNLEKIPLDDTETFRTIRETRTVGCFQLESPAIRGLLGKMVVENLDDVITAVALVRPGPSEGGMKELYIKRRAGVEKTEYIHPKLKDILEDTYGIIIYQEQVLQIAHHIAGFSFGEADVLRRAMTKSREQNVMKSMQQKFIDGACTRGMDSHTAERIWSMLEHFVGYGFNKAHSATYGLIGYKTAFLKTHYPAEFMTAVLNNYGGFYSRAEYIEESRRLGIKLLPSDINEAEEEFSCPGNTIRVGFSSVAELTRRSIRRILSERRKRRFTDIYDFLGRCQPSEKEAAHLVRCGGMQSLESSEPNMLAKIKIFFRNKRNPVITQLLTRHLNLPPYDYKQRILNEMSILGFSITGHPLMLFPNLTADHTITASSNLKDYTGETVKTAGWLVTSRRVPVKNGKYMKFITFGDSKGMIECVLFPDVYRKYGPLIRDGGLFIAIGKVQSRVPGEANLIIERLKKLQYPSASHSLMSASRVEMN